MRARKTEHTIFKVSVVAACLIIGSGLVGRMVSAGTYAAPVNSTAQTTSTAQTMATTATSIVEAIPTQGSVVAIGDSFTYGYPYGPSSAWVGIAGQDLKRDFINAGKTGQTSTDLLARFNNDVVKLKPSAVIITVGTGDALRNVPLSDYQTNMQELITQAKLNNIVPVVGLPLAYPDTAATQLINDYRAWLTAYAPTVGVKVIDFNQVLYNSAGQFNHNLSNDGRYPDKQGYQAMALAVEQIFAPAD
ncbi:MAG: GDSL-type esterase/lipase family protein [Peptococcaceae bacterium]|nr:GDSL-type esterase/lipase family protein [Peptococcaceae bacterium]